MVLISFISTVSYSDVKWIPIEPIKKNESFIKQDSNKSKAQPNNKMLENVQAIINILDHTNKDNIKTENKKKWYELDDLENN